MLLVSLGMSISLSLINLPGLLFYFETRAEIEFFVLLDAWSYLCCSSEDNCYLRLLSFVGVAFIGGKTDLDLGVKLFITL